MGTFSSVKNPMPCEHKNYIFLATNDIEGYSNGIQMKLGNNLLLPNFSIYFYPQANNFSCPKAPECFSQNVCENNNLLTSFVTTFF